MSANREPYIQQGQVDLVVATYTINDKRKEVVNFAGPYYQAGQDLLVPALNEMFDITTVRLAATWTHPPLIVYAMLVALALASALLSGYRSANERSHEWMHKLGFATIVAATIYVILDIEYPRLGLVRVDAIDELLVAVRASMK